ncbi:cytochrome-c peroxidase [Flavobacterium sp. 3HN19-14]|uniref:cytochrome-c peroxidase n=1 Tax=Flavobacterium sp. 3HN19-14 TaxID=3448133 RepID=UPI003EE20549
MGNQILKRLLFIVIAPFLICSCSDKDEYVAPVAKVLDLPETPYDYSVNLPSYFYTNDGSPLPTAVTNTDNTPSTNPITNEGATLGRVLFYDKNLSQNRTIACASCHKQAESFTDSATNSVGFLGGLTRRHSMTLVNARFYRRGRFFWDERAATLEQQVLMPIQDATEMGLTLEEISARVSEQAYYPDLFTAAFGDSIVTSERISKALAQFVRSIVSYNTKYDIGRAQVTAMAAPFPNFTDEENEGKTLFLKPVDQGGGSCFSCHTTEAFVNTNAGQANNGLDLETLTDFGALETFPEREDFTGAFKVTTLRNIELTAPYMHDGRLLTLEAVINHYDHGVQNNPNLGLHLRDANGNPIRLHFTDAQKSALLAFLKTLTDHTVTTDVKWSSPFVN